MLVSFEKGLRLLASEFVQIGIHATSLYDILQVKIRLSVTDQVNFFTVQFCAILGPASS